VAYCARSRVGKREQVKGELDSWLMANKVIERVQPRYEVQAVEFGKVYKWRPERVVVDCQCGQRLSLTPLTTSCAECGTDHVLAVKESSTDGHKSDQTLHPWRY
jgi:hypothetical protein